MKPREIIARRLHAAEGAEEEDSSHYEFLAEEALAALAADEWVVGKFEQVGWIDYERSDEERQRRSGYGRFALIEFGDHDGEQYGNEPVYRRLDDDDGENSDG